MTRLWPRNVKQRGKIVKYVFVVVSTVIAILLFFFPLKKPPFSTSFSCISFFFFFVFVLSFLFIYVILAAGFSDCLFYTSAVSRRFFHLYFTTN